jgi:hypothetical protein
LVDFRTRVDRVLNHCTNIFGEEIIFYPKKGGVYKVRGVFDNEYRTIDPDTEQVLSVNQPALGINLNDFPIEISIEDSVKVRGLLFKIVDKREDGQGGALLMLHKSRASDKIKDTTAN